jgi:23S rRNA (cytosine1962-C5)-methyltransferase
MNQDTSFYCDTRNLRYWLTENTAGWQVLNTFAYTGSLGIAALAGSANQVIQSDRNKKFLGLARQSAIANHLDLGRMKLCGADFFSEVSRLKRENILFDCVILDPPFFSNTSEGTVDLVNQSTRLINKVRPLVKDGGWLVAINNALFLSGIDYFQSLENLCRDGYLAIEQIIPIPEDITGFPETIVNDPPVDPTPFNHPTKIALLKVKRK